MARGERLVGRMDQGRIQRVINSRYVRAAVACAALWKGITWWQRGCEPGMTGGSDQGSDKSGDVKPGASALGIALGGGDECQDRGFSQLRWLCVAGGLLGRVPSSGWARRRLS